MLPFFLDTLLEPLRKRAARKRREKAEAEADRIASVKARIKMQQELAKRGCGHAGRGETCLHCLRYRYQHRPVSWIDGTEIFYR